MDQLAQFYNEQFKQPEDLPFETLSPDDAQRFEKIFKHSFSFAAWKFGKAKEGLKNALNEQLIKIGFKLR